MFLKVEPTSPIPMYRQIMDQLRFAVASGRLTPGEKLPSVRDVAIDLQINLQTVVKAYNELVREGALAMQRGMGTYVAGNPKLRENGQYQEALEAQARKLCRDAFAFGISSRQLSKLIEKVWSQETRR